MSNNVNDPHPHNVKLEDIIEPIEDSSDPSLHMPIKLLRKRNKKTDTNLGLSVRRSTRINQILKVRN
jgi:hypothetical protein